MKTINGELIKNLREELGLSQESFAEKINVSVSTLHRMENNKSYVDVFQYADMLSIFNKSADDFNLLFLDTKEYYDYNMYRSAYNYYTTLQFSKWDEIMAELSDSPLIRWPYIQQQLSLGKLLESVHFREANPSVFTAEDLDELYKVSEIALKDFDDATAASDLFYGSDFDVIMYFLKALSSLKEHKRAICICKALVDNKHIQTNLQIYTLMQIILVNMYYAAEMYSDAYDMAIKCYRRNIKDNMLINVGFLLKVIAICHKKMGNDELYYKSTMQQAYYIYALLGIDTLCESIRKDIEEIMCEDAEDWIKY